MTWEVEGGNFILEEIFTSRGTNLSIYCSPHLAPRLELSEVSQMYTSLYVKYPFFLSDFNEIDFSRQIFQKNSQNFMKTPPAEAKLFRAGGRTDMTKTIVAYRKFVNAHSD